MKPELKYLHSPDVHDLEKYEPPEDEPYYILVQAMFGPEGIDAEESFDALFCNTIYVRQQKSLGLNLEKYDVVLDKYHFNRILDYFNNAALNSEGASWNEVAEKLSRYGKWEFENYRE